MADAAGSRQGEDFEFIYRNELGLARDYKAASHILTLDEACGIEGSDEAERRWNRALEFEGWIREWRDCFFYELFGATDPERVRERWNREQRERPNESPG